MQGKITGQVSTSWNMGDSLDPFREPGEWPGTCILSDGELSLTFFFLSEFFIYLFIYLFVFPPSCVDDLLGRGKHLWFQPWKSTILYTYGTPKTARLND